MYDLRNEKIKRRIVIYARVSTEHEAQLYALDNQIDWYKSILNDHLEWTLVEQYIDEGITGTSAKKRPKFMKMIRDAKKHRFDMIITREVQYKWLYFNLHPLRFSIGNDSFYPKQQCTPCSIRGCIVSK